MPLVVRVSELLDAGVRWLWLRDRDLPADERRALAVAIADLIHRTPGAVLSVGADVDLAAEVGAGGVHLASAEGIADARRRLGPEILVGISAHSVADVAAARDGGADYATLSPIFPSASKPGYGPALGVAALGTAAGLGLPVLALGGVSVGTAPACLAAGAAGIAVMGDAMRGGVPSIAPLLDALRRVAPPPTCGVFRPDGGCGPVEGWPSG